MTTTIGSLNSVNIAAVGDLVTAIQEEPANADTIWKSTVDWKGGFRSEARSRDFEPVPSDEPLGLGGHGQEVDDGSRRVGAVDAVGPAVRVGDPALADLVEQHQPLDEREAPPDGTDGMAEDALVGLLGVHFEGLADDVAHLRLVEGRSRYS